MYLLIVPSYTSSSVFTSTTDSELHLLLIVQHSEQDTINHQGTQLGTALGHVMTAMMSPPAGNHFMPPAPPRSGILLNASPSSSAQNSPKRPSYLLMPFPSNAAAVVAVHKASFSSHSSASSSTSSTDDIVSSTSATSAGGIQASTSSRAAHQPPRKIRFAPLPEPRRNEYEFEDDLLSPGFFAEVDSAASSPHIAAHALLSAPVLPHIIQPKSTPTRTTYLNESHALSSGSMLGLSFDGSDPPDSGQATETNTIAGSDCGTDETHTLSNCKKKPPRWTRLLRLPKTAPLKSSPRIPDEHSGQFNLWRSSSRESSASACSSRTGAFGHMLGSLSDSNASTASLGNPLSRWKSAGGADSVPVSPALSFRGGLSLKPIVSEAGTAAAPAVRGAKVHSHSTSAPPTVRRGTRLLNGRVYGSRPVSASKNPFANVRDTEPEFVEWGHGGMGSVQGGAGAGSSQWAALQSSKKLSVGHEDGPRVADEDDGSGMGWVRRRREQRERERKEKEECEAREREKGKEVASDGEVQPEIEGAEVERVTAKEDEQVEQVVSEASKIEVEPSAKKVPGPVSPADASEEKELRDPQVSEEKAAADEKREMKEENERKEREYVYHAVTVPAPRSHHHHTHSVHSVLSNHSRSHSLTNSALGTPTTEVFPYVLGSGSPLGTPGAAVGPGPSPLALAGAGTALGERDEASTPSSSASSSFEEESPIVDKDEDRDAEGDGEEDDEDDEDEQARKTAIGAGVEKISRHKE